MSSSRSNHRASALSGMLGLILLLSFAVNVRGAMPELHLPAPRGHVNDFAAVVDAATQRRLDNILDNFRQRTGINFVIATVKTAGDQDLYDYSLRVASDWNIGSQASTQKTVLILIATDTGRFFTHYSQSVQEDLPTGLVGYMGRRMRPQFQEGNYSGGLLTGIQTFVSILGERLNFTFEAMDQQSGTTTVAVQTQARSSETNGTEKLQPSKISAPRETLMPRPAETMNQQRSEMPRPSPASPTQVAAIASSQPVARKLPAPALSPKTIDTSQALAGTLMPNSIAPSAQNIAKPGSITPSGTITAIPQSAPGLNSLKRATGTGVLYGQVIDALGGLVVGATLTVIDPAGVETTMITDSQGNYVVSKLAPGKYGVRATAPGFAVYENPAIEIAPARRQTLNIRLEVTIGKQEVTVAAESPLGSSMNMRVLRGKDLAALPSGPGGLGAALRALAVPSTGPNGPQIIVNGFSGGRLPPKDSIREIRINENPFSSEYPQLGFGRIEILTKPGTDKLQASAFFNFNDESLNSRNPFAPNRAPFQSRLYGGSLSGPIMARRLSFFAEFERYEVNNNALINATVLDPALNITRLSRAVLTPQRRTTFSPRFEFQLNSANTIVARYSYTRANSRNAGVGDFSLGSRAYDTSSTERLLQLTDTAVLGPNVINETRFQYLRNRKRETGNNSIATILVPEAFIGGGSQTGLSFNNEDRWELQNYTTWSRGRHSLKAGGQLRGVRITDSSTQDFGGTFTFSGGLAPQLDSANNVVRDANGQPIIAPITSIERYRRTQLTPVFQQPGLTLQEIRALGAGATQFSIAAGDPETRVSQYDLGVFAQDDWQLRPNLTLGLGLRYELQNNTNDHSDFAPRLALAWAPGRDPNKRKTVLRAGMGLFYDRFSEGYTLEARRFNGISQQRFIVSDPAILDLFPQVPSLNMLSAFAVPQTITRVARDLRAPYTIQSSVSLERELPHGFTLASTFINTRTLHMLRSRNINAPLQGTFVPGTSGVRPFGDVGDIYQYESSGYFKQNQLAVNVVERFKKVMTLWATYILNDAIGDTDGANTFPANTYDLTTEHGRSAVDVRHSFYLGGWITGPWKISLNPLIFVRSGAPFNITTGRDTNGDTQFTERPAFASNLSRSSVVLTRFGTFDLDPAPGQTIIPRNYGRGPGFFSVNLGVSRAFSFGTEAAASSHRGGTNTHNGFGTFFSARRYTLTFTIQVENLFNHTNPGLPIGSLSSLLFGQSYSSAGAFGFGSNPAGNRRIEFQIYLNF